MELTKSQEQIREEIKEEPKQEIKEEAKVVLEKKVTEEQPKKSDPIKPQEHVIPDYKLDQFDVRNKIRNSVEVANRQKEEREKLSEEKRKLEQEHLAREKEERDRKKVKKPFVAKKNFEEEDSKKKPGPG